MTKHDRLRPFCLWAMAVALGSVPTSAADPDVPPGRDAGGVAIAIIGSGLDYKRPEIARRLARDGEGELVGYDFADDDPHPFAAQGETATALALASSQAPLRIAVVRIDATDQVGAAKGAAFVSKSPARIAIIANANLDAQGSSAFAKVATQVPNVLFIVADSGGGVPMPAVDNVIAGAKLEETAELATAATQMLAESPEVGGAELKARLLAPKPLRP